VGKYSVDKSKEDLSVNPTLPAKVDYYILRQVSWLELLFFTVARQLRIYTGFPIFPVPTGTP
jgi:hypothetical protein